LEISTGIASRVRLSSRPDRIGISGMAFQVSFSQMTPGWAAQKTVETFKNVGSDKP